MTEGNVLTAVDEVDVCTNCGARRVSVGGQAVCPSCGLIANQEPVIIESLRSNISTYRKINSERIFRLKSSSNYNKSLLKVLDVSKKMSVQLKLPRVVLDMALDCYIKVKGNLKPKRIPHISLFIAALLICARSVGHTLSFSELRVALEKIGYKTKQKELLRALSLLKASGFYVPPANTENFIVALVSRLLDEGALDLYTEKGIPMSQFIVQRAKRLLRELGYERLAGKNPRVLAGAAVYAAIRQLTQNRKPFITQRQIAKFSGIAEYSVRDCYGRMFSPLLSTGDKALSYVPREAEVPPIIQ